MKLNKPHISTNIATHTFSTERYVFPIKNIPLHMSMKHVWLWVLLLETYKMEKRVLLG